MNEFEMLSVGLSDPEAFLHVIRNMCILCSQAVIAIYQNADGVLLAAAASSLTQAELN